MKEIRINLTAAEIRAYQAWERVLQRRVKPQPEEIGRLICFELPICSPFGSPGERLDIRMRVSGMWIEYDRPTVRRVTVEQIDGEWWWVCEVE